MEEEFYVCPHHCDTGGYESCCSCGKWSENEPHRLCTENPDNKTGYDLEDDLIEKK
jgi:hypothetical protein